MITLFRISVQLNYPLSTFYRYELFFYFLFLPYINIKLYLEARIVLDMHKIEVIVIIIIIVLNTRIEVDWKVTSLVFLLSILPSGDSVWNFEYEKLMNATCFLIHSVFHCLTPIFDVQVVGGWEDVLTMCRKGHLQPQVLFFEAVN